jgi:hypothetical protein
VALSRRVCFILAATLVDAVDAVGEFESAL